MKPACRSRAIWQGDETVCVFHTTPVTYCHPGLCLWRPVGIPDRLPWDGQRSAAAYRAEGREMDSLPALRFLTASLQVSYLKPTPLGVTLEVHGRIKEVKGRKVIVEEWIVANEEVTVRGEVIAVQVPDQLIDELSQAS